jgi:hypothetical protein
MVGGGGSEGNIRMTSVTNAKRMKLKKETFCIPVLAPNNGYNYRKRN